MLKIYSIIFSLIFFNLSAEIIQKVNIIGNDRISKETIKVYGDINIGKDYSSFDINKILKFHEKHKFLATVTAVQPPARFGVLKFNQIQVKKFQEKVDNKNVWINGGFFVFNNEIFKYLKKSEDSLEHNVLIKVVKNKQLAAYKHNRFWLPMDTLRDKIKLNELLKKNKAPWKFFDEKKK